MILFDIAGFEDFCVCFEFTGCCGSFEFLCFPFSEYNVVIFDRFLCSPLSSHDVAGFEAFLQRVHSMLQVLRIFVFYCTPG